MSKAPILARRLGKYGVNYLLPHHIDHRWPNGMLIWWLAKSAPHEEGNDGSPSHRDFEPKRSLDPEAMARLDYLTACCSDNGIYINLNLNMSRPFTAADGIKQVDWIGFGKGQTYFDPQSRRSEVRQCPRRAEELRQVPRR